jgi:hypothetical protein
VIILGIFYGKRSKKADLSLSVNTIVIIVLAITLLGLGLSFIRGIVGGSFGRLQTLVDSTDLDKQPTSQDPLTITSPLEIKRNSQVTTKIGFYNKASITLAAVKPKISKCISIVTGTELTDADLPQIISLSKDELAPSESQGYQSTIKIGALAEGRYTCKLTMEATGDAKLPETDITINVTP